MKPVTYEGTEPYIFVSYAHRDSEQVMNVISSLQEHGYRLWYDDGIAPGSEWPEDIAQHLDRSSVVMAFITPNSVASQNCRREITFSLSREKPFLSVLMEPTEMPLGLEMQLSAQQMIVRDNYTEWDGFINKIMACPDLAQCRSTVAAPKEEERPQAQVASLPAELEPQHVEPEPKPAEPAPKPAEPAPQPVETKPVPPEPAISTQSAPDTPAPVPTKQPKPRLPLKVIIPLALALVAVVVGITLAASPKPSSTAKTIELSWGSEPDRTSYFVARDKTLTQSDLKTIASLDQLTSLMFEGCDLSGCDFSNITFASQKISKVSLAGSTGISDFSFLDALPLAELNVAGCSTFDSLATLPLENLTKLDVSGTAVRDLAPLTKATNLENIDASDTDVTSFDALAGLEKLTSLSLDNCLLEAPGSQLAALRLASVHLANTGLVDLSFLANCTVLEALDISGNTELSDLSWLDPQNQSKLAKLNVSQTSLNVDVLASYVTQCPNLSELSLDGLSLGTLELCKGLKNLTVLSAMNCGLNDIAALEACPELRVILLSHNKIADVSPLAALASINHDDTIIDLSDNALTSVEALPDGNYRALMLQGNAQDIGKSLTSGLQGYEVVLPWYDGMQNSALATSHGFSRVYLLDCPQNQVLAMEDALGSGSVVFIDEDELRTLYETDGFDYPLNLGSSSHSSGSGDVSFSVNGAIGYEMEPISIGNSEG